MNSFASLRDSLKYGMLEPTNRKATFQRLGFLRPSAAPSVREYGETGASTWLSCCYGTIIASCPPAGKKNPDECKALIRMRIRAFLVLCGIFGSPVAVVHRFCPYLISVVPSLEPIEYFGAAPELILNFSKSKFRGPGFLLPQIWTRRTWRAGATRKTSPR
jgi:hypothetical protein